MKTIIFDIDGTLADNSHRQHHLQKEPPDWDAFFEAMGEDGFISPIGLMEDAVQMVGSNVFVTGRPEKYRSTTHNWLIRHLGYMLDTKLRLYMRKDGDHRPDHVVKEEILHQLKAEGHDILCVFDDRKRCVDMWRRNGLLCFQVADGDF